MKMMMSSGLWDFRRIYGLHVRVPIFDERRAVGFSPDLRLTREGSDLALRRAVGFSPDLRLTREGSDCGESARR
ncbi:hypothetical protein CASFOL_005966 [Castilleja foliolosa]|uniref:Uncharacterized protein n=1 Tax=Castilleja foliolosa TaxID=1961234 RepID=A0ABD3E5C5_9LAMI